MPNKCSRHAKRNSILNIVSLNYDKLLLNTRNNIISVQSRKICIEFYVGTAARLVEEGMTDF